MSDRSEQLKRMLQDDPADTFCLYGLALEHAKAGRHDDAISLFDRTLEIDPHYCYAYFHKAKSLEAAGRVDEAMRALGTGQARAREAGDAQAMNEIAAYLDELS